MNLAETLLNRTRAMGAQNAEAEEVWVWFLRARARQEEGAGSNPIPSLKLAVEKAQAAQLLAPGSVNINYLLLATYGHLLEAMSARDLETERVYSLAKRTAEDLMRRFPDVATYPGALGQIEVEIANRDSHHGKDPKALLRDAIPRLELARRLNPQIAQHTYALANAHLILGETADALGTVSEEDVRHCKSLYGELIATTPAYPHFRIGLAMALELEAREVVRRQGDPSPLIQSARAELATAERAISGYWVARLIKARLYILEGRHADAMGRPPGPWFAKAEAELNSLKRTLPEQPEIATALGALEKARREPMNPFRATPRGSTGASS
jgi:tetratricopeptide (TPR) repeat protein